MREAREIANGNRTQDERGNGTADGAAAGSGICPMSARAAQFDPFDEPFQADPPGSLAWARAEEPVFFSPAIGYWIVTRYEDVRAVFRDQDTFSPSIALEKITPTSAEAEAVLRRYDYAMNRTLVNEDEPAHMERRRALMGFFSPAALAEHEPLVRRLTRTYVDRFIDVGKADLVDEMLWEIPLTVALHFLGVPEDDMEELRRYSIAHTVNTWGKPRPEEQVAVAEAVGLFWKFSGRVLDKMRRDPDMPGWMPFAIRVQRDRPDVVTDSYLHSMMMAIIVAAHETTANAAANAVKLLLERREVWDEICADSTLIPNAVEECLRHSGSFVDWRRIAVRDAHIGRVAVPAGSKILLVTSSANHDERHFSNPEEIDLRRDNVADHLTFGFGNHECLGKNLARLEIQIFLQEFTNRLPHMQLVPDQEFTYLPNVSVRGPDHLFVEWDPERNPERGDPSILNRVNEVAIGEPPVRPRSVVVKQIVSEADEIVRLTLADPSGRALPRWEPGSHIDLQCGEVIRQYSLCGDPSDPSAYEIAVLRESDSRGGSRHVHDRIGPGAVLAVRGPRNHFPLADDAEHYILIAGGIGITPIIAMADALKARNASYEIHYAGRSRSTMAFLDRLELVHGEVTRLYIKEEAQRLALSELLGSPCLGTRIYACGPQRLLEGLQVESASWPKGALQVEHFKSDLPTLDPTKERTFGVILNRTGRAVSVSGSETVLQALRKAGVKVDSTCEEGLCGSCETAVVAGDVDHRDRVLSLSEREEGRRMMVCCSRARCGDLVLDL